MGMNQEPGNIVIWKDWQFWSIAGLIALISILHFSADLTDRVVHDVYRRLYYLPIILAAFRYQWRGGLLTALFISIIYFPHLLQHWAVNPDQGVNKLLEIFLYLTVGGLTGWLVTRQERERRRYQITANLLEQSLQEQRQQAARLIKTEENLRVADRMAVLGELTASLAHEVRNPLGSIKGSANLLANNNLNEHERTEVAEILQSEADRMNQVVENYLGAARGRDVEKHTFALSEVCDSIKELIREKAKKRGIRFDVSLPERPVTLNMNMNQLYQILLNLVLNAIDAMPNGGTIHMESARRNGTLQITITDEGTGIPKDKLDKIWETFYTTKKEGTGLGLPIVKRIVEENNGEIHLESKKGRGTTVGLTLPLGAEL